MVISMPFGQQRPAPSSIGWRCRAVLGGLILAFLTMGLNAAEGPVPPGPPALDLDRLPELPSINDGLVTAPSDVDALRESHASMDRLLGEVVSYVVQERSQGQIGEGIYSAVRPPQLQAEETRLPEPPVGPGEGGDAAGR